VDERRPAVVPVLAREHELRARQPHGQVGEPPDRLGVAAARRAHELLRLLA